MNYEQVKLIADVDRKIKRRSYSQMVAWFFLFPVLLPLVLMGRLLRSKKKPNSIDELSLVAPATAKARLLSCDGYDRKAEAKAYDKDREDKVHPERWDADRLGYLQDDGTYISEESLQWLWMGEHLHDLVPGRLYNITQAMRRGEWANGKRCEIDEGLEAAILTEGLRRKVMDNMIHHERRNMDYAAEFQKEARDA